MNDRGKEIFKGGNVEVMQDVLKVKVMAKDLKCAEAFFYNYFLSHGGSNRLDYYQVVEV